MTETATPARDQAGAALPVTLAITQVVAWGTTFYPVPVLAEQIAAELVTPVVVAAAAPTVLLLATALMSLPTSSWLVSQGSRRMMAGGTLVGAAGLALVASAQSVLLYLIGWAIAGIAGAAMLTLGAQVTIARHRPLTVRRDLRLMMLATSLPPAVFWPLTHWLASSGWRTVFAGYAGLLLVSALALVLVLPARPPVVAAPPVRSAERSPAQRGGDRRMVPLIAAISLNGFVSGGLPLVFIPLLIASGLDASVAIAVSAGLGVVKAGSRALTLVIRVPAIVEAIGASVVMLVGVTLLLGAERGGVAIAVGSVVLFGAGSGVIAVARATVPHELFEPAAYARVSGRISLPLNLVFAVAPMVFAALVAASTTAAVVLAVGLVAGAICCLLALRAAA